MPTLRERVAGLLDPGSSTIGMLLADSSESDPVSEETSIEEYDADPHEVITGDPSIADYRLWTQQAAQFIRSDSGLEEEDDGFWIGKRPLGQGSFGMAGLWEKYDGDGDMVDQVVIKQMGKRRKRGAVWDPAMPKEVKMMRKLNETKCPSIVRIRGYRRYPHLEIHRIYMEFCEHGDLRKLCKRYRRFRRHFPEPFLWEMFHYMAEAVLAMALGPQNPDQNASIPLWQFEIVHRDIKPANVFLGKENPDSLLSYPTPKLGDFGLATRTKALEDRNNPVRLRGAGTPKYMAPEQRSYDKLPLHLRNTNTPLSSYTNVWAIGAIMFELITLHSVDHFLLPGAGNNNEGVAEIRSSRDPEYTNELREIVRMCLRPFPKDRPNTEELVTRLKEYRDVLKGYFQSPDENSLIPATDLDYVYYRGNEIDNMFQGGWEPSRAAAASGPETGFRDPSLVNVNFPKWPPIPDTTNDEAESDDSSIVVIAERRIMAGTRELDDDEEEKENRMATEADSEGDDGMEDVGDEEYEADVDIVGHLNQFGRMRMN